MRGQCNSRRKRATVTAAADHRLDELINLRLITTRRLGERRRHSTVLTQRYRRRKICPTAGSVVPVAAVPNPTCEQAPKFDRFATAGVVAAA